MSIRRHQSENPRKQMFSDEQIRAKAYELWLKRGGTNGDDKMDWTMAEKSLKYQKRTFLFKWAPKAAKAATKWFIFSLPVLDWTKLLAVPITLSLATGIITARIQDETKQNETLNKYLEGMSADIKSGLINARIGSDIFVIAQAKTVIALQSLDPKRQHLVVQFLDAATLNTLGGKKGVLYSARLSKASLNNADLSFIHLIHANLRQAQLYRANLVAANLSGADLSGADLREAIFSDADFRGANLMWSDLRGAKFSEADLSNANLSQANLSKADIWGIDLTEADLSGANLSGANLENADLSNANLEDADLKGANLWGANLRGADFSNADLSGTNLSGAQYCLTILPSGKIGNDNCEKNTHKLAPEAPRIPKDWKR
jgi:uncharacterized protein YjbI with pentapeptide repeats